MGRRSATPSREEQHISEPRINDRIRVPEVRLVGPNGEQVGIVRVEDALRLAQEADLDLVEVAPDARPPVCKLMDYGKFKYESAMKARDARRNQANTVLKEIRFRLKIDPHDYGTKKGHVERFLSAGDKVKIMIMFRGREQSRPEAGMRLLQRLADDVAELGVVESAPRLDGRNMIMVLAPTKKKSEVRVDQRRRTRDAAPDSEIESEAEDFEPTVDAPAPAAPQAPPAEAAPVRPVAAPPAARPATQPVQPASRPAAPSSQPAPRPVTPRPASAPVTPRPSSAPAAPRPAASPAPAPRPSSAPAPRPAQPAPRPAGAPSSSSGPAPAPAPRPASTPAPRPGEATPRPAAPRPATPRPGATPAPAPRATPPRKPSPPEAG